MYWNTFSFTKLKCLYHSPVSTTGTSSNHKEYLNRAAVELLKHQNFSHQNNTDVLYTHITHKHSLNSVLHISESINTDYYLQIYMDSKGWNLQKCNRSDITELPTLKYSETWISCSLILCFFPFQALFYQSCQTYHKKNVKILLEYMGVLSNQILNYASKRCINWFVTIILGTFNWKSGQ